MREKLSENQKHVDLRIIKTRNALSEALISLLKEKKFDDIKVNDLCEVAGISRATFYNNFNTLEEILVYYLTKLSAPIMAKVQRRVEEESLSLDEAYRYYIMLSCTRLFKGEKTLRQIFDASISPKLFLCMALYVKKQLNEILVLYPDVHFTIPKELLVNYIAGGFAGLLYKLVTSGNEYSLDEQVEYIYRLSYELYAPMLRKH